MKTCLLALLATAFLSGCATTTVNTVERAQADAVPSYVADRRVITDNSLAGTFRVASINQATVSGNLLKVQATVENLRTSTRALNYQFSWVDRNGMALASPTDTWKSVRVQGRETITISSVAMSPLAADFTLKLSE